MLRKTSARIFVLFIVLNVQAIIRAMETTEPYTSDTEHTYGDLQGDKTTHPSVSKAELKQSSAAWQEYTGVTQTSETTQGLGVVFRSPFPGTNWTRSRGPPVSRVSRDTVPPSFKTTQHVVDITTSGTEFYISQRGSSVQSNTSPTAFELKTTMGHTSKDKANDINTTRTSKAAPTTESPLMRASESSTIVHTPPSVSLTKMTSTSEANSESKIINTDVTQPQQSHTVDTDVESTQMIETTTLPDTTLEQNQQFVTDEMVSHSTKDPFADNGPWFKPTSSKTRTDFKPARISVSITYYNDEDSFWPIALALTIGIPSIIVLAVTITVLYRRRMTKPRNFMGLYDPEYLK